MPENVSPDEHGVNRKHTLVTIGIWALNAGKGWLVRAVPLAPWREGLRDD